MRRTPFYSLEHAKLLASPNWARCEPFIESFEKAWKSGSPPCIADFLRADGEMRKALLTELIHVDLEFRIKSGNPIRMEEYLAVYPEIAEDASVSLTLIAAEMDEKRRLGTIVDAAEYRARFPDYAEEIRRLADGSQSASSYPTFHDSLPAPYPQARPLIPGYEVLEEIGRGGMGIVYKARETQLGRLVALKILPSEYARDPGRLQRFLREARTASNLNHPHVCTVHALGEHEGCPYIVMELIEGTTLRGRITNRVDPGEAARLIAQAARALATAHAAGMVHRDVKPENIMVRGDGYVKVLDFGLARLLPTVAAQDVQSIETDPGLMLGTVAYMSPEHSVAAESASDVFSLGIVTYQLLTGVHPFKAETPFGMLSAIATHPVVPPSRLNPETPVAFSHLVEAMLQKSPPLRPTAAEVAKALESLADDGAPILKQITVHRPIVHREAELGVLRAALADADAGCGSYVCIAGEPGIGKTTLAEDFLAEVKARSSNCLVARGNCSERLADTEAYLPAINALESLIRQEGNGAAARLMRVVAPSWYAQLSPVTHEPSPSASHVARASSQAAMLREFHNFVQEAARLSTVVLFFDDVHWADHATVDLLAYLGRYCRELRLLIIVTYRPTEMLLGSHPFRSVKLELQGRGACKNLLLGFLQREDVARYLDVAFPNHAFPYDFAPLIHARTEGNPLFMADLLRYLCERGVLAETADGWSVVRELPDLSRELPESTRSMIARKIDQLTEDDRRLLAAASVQGQEFDSTIVGDALGWNHAEIEERLQAIETVHGLVRLLREQELPDRTLNLRYRFVHALYQQSLHDGLSPTRRAGLGAALAAALEKHYAESSSVAAAELAYLYEVGRHFSRAAHYCDAAAQNAARVFAHQEALALARRGIKLLDSSQASPEAVLLELQLQTTLGLQLQITQGYAAPIAQSAYSRARELCAHVSGRRRLFPVLWGLWLCSKVGSDLATAQNVADDLFDLARELNDPDLELQARQALGMTALCSGHPEASRKHVERAAELYDPNHHGTHASQFGQDPGVICKGYGAAALWLLGFPDTAAEHSADTIRMSEQLSPISQVVALYFATMVHQLRRDAERTWQLAEACSMLATEHGFSFWMAGSTILGGWARAAQGDCSGGIAAINRGLDDWQKMGSVTYRTYFLGLLAEALDTNGQHLESGEVLEQALALVPPTGECFWEGELNRLRGENVLYSSPGNEKRAGAYFAQAIQIARQQKAKSLELRAQTGRLRLWHESPEHATGARQELAMLLADFQEGLDTLDQFEALALLEQTAEG